MMDFLTSGAFLVPAEILVIVSLAAILIRRIRKNRQEEEKRQELAEKERDMKLTMLLQNDLAGSAAGKNGARLVIRIQDGGRKKNASFPQGQPVRIGRSGDNDLVLESRYAARHQCTLVWNGQRLTLRQEDTPNPVKILRGGEKAGHAGGNEKLESGDVLSFADVRLELILQETA